MLIDRREMTDRVRSVRACSVSDLMRDDRFDRFEAVALQGTEVACEGRTVHVPIQVSTVGGIGGTRQVLVGVLVIEEALDAVGEQCGSCFRGKEVTAASKSLSDICERRVPDGTPRDNDGQFLLAQLSLAGDYGRRSSAASNGGALIAGYYHLLKAATCADIGKNYDRILGSQGGKTKAADKTNPLLAAVEHIIELRREVAKARAELALAIKDTIASKQLAMKLEALNAQLSPPRPEKPAVFLKNSPARKRD